MAKKDIVAIGGSTGSHAVLQQIIGDLPADLPASIFVTTHVPSNAPVFLADALARVAQMRVVHATDGQPIERGCIYVAVPNRHMLVVDGTVRLGDGPRENMTRPSIDPLFRSAALSYGPRVVGVMLSGILNDGAAGLWAIKACGGTAVVQHPLDAEAEEMPSAGLEAAAIDEVAPARELGTLLAGIIRSDAGDALHPPDSLMLEVDVAGGTRLGAASLRDIMGACRK